MQPKEQQSHNNYYSATKRLCTKISKHENILQHIANETICGLKYKMIICVVFIMQQMNVDKSGLQQGGS